MIEELLKELENNGYKYTKELGEKVKNALPDLDVDDIKKCMEVCAEANKCIIVATENRTGWIGAAPAILSTWAMMTEHLIDEFGKDLIDQVYENAKEEPEKDNIDEYINNKMEELKNKLNDRNNEESTNSKIERLKEIDKLLQELD